MPLGMAGMSGAWAGSGLEPVTVPAPPAGLGPEALAADSGYWSQVAQMYEITDEVVHLENGYWGSMARPVLEAYLHWTRLTNHGNAWYGRREFPRAFARVRAEVAEMLGVAVEEVVLTRGATEALQALIGGYNRLQPGDAVLYADLDYDSMITAMRWLRERRGVELVSIDLPAPGTYQDLIDAYAMALERHRNLKLLLLTQVSHRTGLVLPVAEIAEMARQRGIDVIVDAAHGVGQLDFRIPDLGADFVGVNLHKWVGAPVGVGAMYIRSGRVQDIDPYMAESAPDDIRTRIHTGTANFAAYLAVSRALEVHARIGVANKQARLRRLRNRWMDALRELPGVELLTPDDPRLSGAIGSFRLRGATSLEANIALARRLAAEHGVFTIHRDGMASGACVRVTPAVFTPDWHPDRLAAAVARLVA